MADGEALFAGNIVAAATRPRVTTKHTVVTEIGEDGQRVVRDTEQTITEPPDVASARFIVERRYAAWAERAKLTLVDGDDEPITTDAIASSLFEKIRAIAEGRAPHDPSDDPDDDDPAALPAVIDV